MLWPLLAHACPPSLRVLCSPFLPARAPTEPARVPREVSNWLRSGVGCFRPCRRSCRSPFGIYPHTPLAGRPHRGLADPAFYIGGEILLVIAGKVHHGLPCPIEKGGVK